MSSGDLAGAHPIICDYSAQRSVLSSSFESLSERKTRFARCFKNRGWIPRDEDSSRDERDASTSLVTWRVLVLATTSNLSSRSTPRSLSADAENQPSLPGARESGNFYPRSTGDGRKMHSRRERGHARISVLCVRARRDIPQ